MHIVMVYTYWRIAHGCCGAKEDCTKTVLRLCSLTLCLGALALTLTQTTGVRADNFTAVGCATGNYSCLVANGGQLPPGYYPGYGFPGYLGGGDVFNQVGCASGDVNCFVTKTGQLPPGYTGNNGYGGYIGATDPFTAVGCAVNDYTCYYGRTYGGNVGITVLPPNYTIPGNLSQGPAAPSTAPSVVTVPVNP